MKKIFLKYFTSILVIILLNSNFSFAISQMICKMSKVQTECPCDMDQSSMNSKISKEQNDCCKDKISEINNSNTLEKNSIRYATDQVPQKTIFTIPINNYSIFSSSINYIYINLKIPVPDIPVINSSLLI